jgi:hypothetical protein
VSGSPPIQAGRWRAVRTSNGVTAATFPAAMTALRRLGLPGFSAAATVTRSSASPATRAQSQSATSPEAKMAISRSP